MAIVEAPAKVLITVWIARTLLENGYSVRGTVRSAQKGEYMKTQFESFGDKFEYVVVPDVIKAGAFDDSVKEIDAVIHAAAPVTFTGTYDTVVKPAIEATETILDSILRLGDKVQRVVMISSYAALVGAYPPGRVYTEEDWNTYAINQVKEQGDQTPPIQFYRAAKTLSERVAWEFVAKHEGNIKWDLVTILPPLVFGPLIHETDNPATSSFMYDNFSKDWPVDQVGQYAGAWVDVRDVAEAHLLALQKQEAGGQRISVSASGFSWQDVYDALALTEPALPDVPKGHPGVERGPLSYPDTSKAARILGLTKYRSLAQSARDTVLSVRSRLAQH